MKGPQDLNNNVLIVLLCFFHLHNGPQGPSVCNCHVNEGVPECVCPSHCDVSIMNILWLYDCITCMAICATSGIVTYD